MKRIIFCLVTIVSLNAYCQGRYSNTTTSTYEPITYGNYVPQSYIPQQRTISCQELFEFIIQNGYKKTTIPNYILQSSWLYEVTAYDYNYKTYVIAKIKKNEYSYQTSSYIFCGIPTQNWSSFQYGGYGDSESYGERFHQYIFDYKCNCE